MKLGRRIRVSHPFLVNLRTNLRKIFLEAIRISHASTINQDVSESSLGNYNGSSKRKVYIQNIYTTLFTSICKCHDCHRKDRDAVYWESEIYEEFLYPPRKEGERDTSVFWLCPDCYDERMRKIELFRKENYVDFWIWGHQVYLNSLGLKDIHEYLNLPEIVAQMSLRNPDDLTEWERNYYDL